MVDTLIPRSEIDILYAASNKLTRASTPTEQLDAVSDYARAQGASAGILLYIDHDAQHQPEWLETVAEWVAGEGVAIGLEQGFYMPSFAFNQVWLAVPDRPTLVSDVLASDLIDDATRANYHRLNTRAVAMLPLNIKGRWVGLLMFTWAEVHAFDERDMRIYTALIQQAGPVIDSMRLFEQTQRRAAELEKANRESQLLYRAGEAINAATSFGEIVHAIAQLADRSLSVMLTLWDHYDFDRAEGFTIAATNSTTMSPAGTRYRIDQFPVAKTVPRKGLIVYEDVATDPRIDEVSRASWLRTHTLARIGVPLTLNNRWMGNLAFHSDQPRVFTPVERRVIGGIGDLVTAAVERLRLKEEQDRLRQRAELLARINGALSQAHDEQAILAAVDAIAARFRADFTHLTYVVSSDSARRPTGVEIVAVRSGARGGAGRPLPLSVFPETIHRVEAYPLLRLIYAHSNELFIVENLDTDPREEADKMRRLARMAPWAATIAIPLKTGEQWQGAITFLWLQPQTFNAEARALFEEIRPTATSVVNSRLAYLAEQTARRETELRARELETVAKVSAAATTRLNVADLLQTVSELTKSSFNLQHVAVYLLEATGDAFAIATGEFAAADMTASREIVRLNDLSSLVARAARLRRGVIAPITEPGSAMAIPMVLADRLVGVLHIGADEAQRFSEADIQVMGTMTDLIVVAVENARLYEKAQELAALEERTRLARELHDSVSQALYGIGLGARTARALLDRDPSKVAEPLDYILSLAEAGLTEMRALIFQLRPESLENEGLVTALSKQAASMQARHGITVEATLCDEPPISLAHKQALYLVGREALHNIVKHAKASKVSLVLHYDGQTCRLEICDDGVGFETGGDFPGHLGLKSMSERVAHVHGQIEIESASGSGTTIRVILPMK